MTNETWSGVLIDPLLLNDRGYQEIITVNGETYERFIGYMAAGIAQCGVAVSTAALSLVSTSTTSLTIGVHAHKTLTVGTGLAFAPGMTIMIANTPDPSTNYMVGVISSYATTTGALGMDVTVSSGAGTFAQWNVSLSGPRGPTGPAGTAGPAGSGSSLAAQYNGTLITSAPRSQLNMRYSIISADDSGGDRVNLNLVGDTLTPGNLKYYGTNSSGDRGWIDFATSVATVVPFATNTDAVTGTSITLAMTPASVVAAFAGRLTKLTTFTGNGTFTKSASATLIGFEAVGGGMAGAQGAAGNTGTGGWGGERQTIWLPASLVPASVAITVGAGGTRASAGAARPPGGGTTVGLLVYARGGSGGAGQFSEPSYGAQLTSGFGGRGGETTGTTGQAGYYLGNGNPGIAGADGTPGAGNVGSSAGAITGSNATSAVAAGAGGPGGGGAVNTGAGDATGGNGGDGAAPGGGGGGGGGAAASAGVSTCGSGGLGAHGQVLVMEILGG